MTTGTAVATIPTGTGVNWASELAGASMLLKSGLAPSSLKTPEAALFVILAGRDLGLSPTQALRSVNVIQGKVEVAADMQLALFKRAGGRAVWIVLTDAKATLDLMHPNGDKHTESFSMEDAKRAGLAGDNWRKYPKAMLRSRCITAGMKSAGFDVLAGVYAPGEIGGPEPSLDPPNAASEAPAKPQEAIQAPAPVEDAVVVDEATGEDVSPLALAKGFAMPFGKKKGTEIDVLESADLQSAMEWAESRKGWADFVEAARLVLNDRQVQAEAMAAEQKRMSFEEAHPALEDDPAGLPL